MRTVRIRQVKGEIRVLGVAVKPSQGGDTLQVVGVVFRGGRWLDGVMKTTAHGLDLTDRLVEMIMASPHHPQVRVLLLHEALIEGGASVDPYRLSMGISRPVIFLSKAGGEPEAWEAPVEVDAQRFELDREAGSQFVLAIGLRRRTATRVLEVSTRDGMIPEALRVADIVSSAVSGCPEQNI